MREGDLALIAQPIDFLGVNYYHDDNVSAHPIIGATREPVVPTDRPTSSPFVGSEHLTFPPRPLPLTAMAGK